MRRSSSRRQPARLPAAADLDAELGRIAAMNIDELRDLWRETLRREPSEALTKDLIARALAHFLQEARLGGLTPQLRKLLASLSKKGAAPKRHLKAGSVIVREYQGIIHEVIVVPDGFSWRGLVYSSLSTIARKITGTSWNGPRFFGLRGEPAPSTVQSGPSAAGERAAAHAPVMTHPSRFASSSVSPSGTLRSNERQRARP